MSSKALKLKISGIVGPGEYGHVDRPLHTWRRPMRIHTHDFAEFFWVNTGSGSQVLNGVRHRLTVGDFWCIRPEEVHSIKAGGDAPLIITEITGRGSYGSATPA